MGGVMTRLYVAGPMTGLPEFNYPAFFAAERALRDLGYDVLNPARVEGRSGCSTWLDFMRASLLDLAECDGIATLPGWQDSRGAALEVYIVQSLGLPVQSVASWREAAA
jgi:hypothetical protein